MWVCRNNNPLVMALLLKHSKEDFINIANTDGKTALFYASEYNSVECIKQLVKFDSEEKKLNVNLRDKSIQQTAAFFPGVCLNPGMMCPIRFNPKILRNCKSVFGCHELELPLHAKLTFSVRKFYFPFLEVVSTNI